jgi:hypothetical protein
VQTYEFERGRLEGHWDCQQILADAVPELMFGNQEAEKQLRAGASGYSPWYWVGYTRGLHERGEIVRLTEEEAHG